MMRLLDEDEALNPILSVVNLVDVFLVVIAALLISIAQNPLNPFFEEDVTVVKNAGKPNMEVIVKQGEKMEQYRATGAVGQGDGVKAGVAYRLEDGSLIYVPENGSTEGQRDVE